MKNCFHEKTVSPIPGRLSLRLGVGKCGKIDAKESADRGNQDGTATTTTNYVSKVSKTNVTTYGMQNINTGKQVPLTNTNNKANLFTK